MNQGGRYIVKGGVPVLEQRTEFKTPAQLKAMADKTTKANEAKPKDDKHVL